MNLTEHDFEPARGLPAPLPAEERVLWQGSPKPASLARQAFRVRGVAMYFAVLMAWRLYGVDGPLTDAAAAWTAIAPPLLMGVLVLGVLCGLAWLNAREAVYTLTNRRIVMRFGVALPMTVNLPLSQVESADLRVHADGTGDISLTLLPSTRVSYLIFWPHVRAWRLNRVRPTLRAIANPQHVAECLRSAVDGATVTSRLDGQAPERPAPDFTGVPA